MPTAQRVKDFIAMVVEENHIEAIVEFYHDDASMQENLTSPRRGKTHLIAHEKESHKKIQSMETFSPLKVYIDEDNVAIHWVFEIIDSLGQRRRLEEVALQSWKGDKIIKEQFFYDSATAWHPVD
ncbi:MAG: nuclear transport factor 2 family protein [Hellea sp.]